MAIELRGTPSTAKKGSVTSLSVTAPTGALPKDFGILIASMSNVAATMTGPTGWTLLTTIKASERENTYAIYYRKLVTGVGSEDLNPSVSASVSTTLDLMYVLIKTGTYNEAAPINAQSSSWTETSKTTALESETAGITTTVANTLLLWIEGGTQTPTTVTGFAQQGESTNEQVWTATQAAVGATGNIKFTRQTKVAYDSYLIAIAPAKQVSNTPAMMV